MVKTNRGHLAKNSVGGGEVENSGSVFLKFWREKKIQELPRTMSQNSVGEEVENSGRVFERLEKKFKGLPRTLNPIQGEGGKSGRVF